jgi:hypothetical protein
LDTENLHDKFSQIRKGRIEEYSIDIWTHGEWKTIYFSTELMGDCKVIHFPKTYSSSKLRCNITKASAPPSLYEVNVIKM